MIDAYISENYFDWLKSETFLTKKDQRDYEGALRLLHDIPFVWYLHSDDNRSGDAVAFRQYEYLDQLQVPPDVNQVALGQWAMSSPSVLEVLLGCARRWHYTYGDWSVPFYFGHMFRGLQLNMFPGRTLEPGTQEAIRDIVDTWLNRQFSPNGLGSPWPLSGDWIHYDDQRTVDMWGQMNAYSREHFQ